MRKLGFTLAEVLITLGIIGVIATLTLPTLMSNTAEREYSTAIKKAISSLTESVQMQVALENVSFDEMIDSGVDSKDNNSLYAFLCRRMQTEKLVQVGSGTGECLPGSAAGTAGCLSYGGANSKDGINYAMLFRDGSALMFNSGAIVSDKKCLNSEGVTVNCFRVIYDTNGVQKPNMVANCLGATGKSSKDFAFDLNVGSGGSGSGDTSDTGESDEEQEGTTGATCTKDNFNARDQYPLYLYGIGAYPGSTAAEYIFTKK